MISKILDRKMFLYYTIFYLLFKYTFFGYGTALTYILFLYAILIFVKDIFDNKGVYKFPGWQFSYLMCISFILSCLIISRKITFNAISGISIFFINFFMYLPYFHKMNYTDMIKTFEKIFIAIVIYSFIKNIIGLGFAAFGIRIENLFGAPFGATYGMRLVTVRETANETGWFAIFSLFASAYFFIKIVKNNLLLNNKMKLYKIFLIINMIIQMITYILSGNRSSIFGIATAFAGIFIIYTLSTKNRKLIVLSIVSVIILIFIGISYIATRIIFGVGSDSVRFDMYRYGIYLLPLTNIVFGSSYVGLRHDLDVNFETIWKTHDFKTSYKYLKQLTYDGNAHNVFIQQLNTNGLLGIIILVLFFVFAFINLIKYIIKIINDNSNFYEKIIPIFFIIFGFVVGNISWSIISTMTCFVNLMFMLSISMVLNIEANNVH